MTEKDIVIRMKQIWCCKGAEFTRDELQAGWEAIERLRGEVERLRGALADWTNWNPNKSIIERQTPAHGSCCTCQECGRHYDDCVCEHNEISRALEEVDGE